LPTVSNRFPFAASHSQEAIQSLPQAYRLMPFLDFGTTGADTHFFAQSHSLRQGGRMRVLLKANNCHPLSARLYSIVILSFNFFPFIGKFFPNFS
jgi:hypothetical protein